MFIKLRDRIADVRALRKKYILNKYEDIPTEEILNVPFPVTWHEANTICHVLSTLQKVSDFTCMLPNEYQWEYAALADRTYGIVNNRDAIIYNSYVEENLDNVNDYPYIRHSPYVCTFHHANPWGLFDMLGNVYEWTSSKYRHPCIKKSATSLCDMYVVKGGSYKEPWRHSRSSYRAPMIRECSDQATVRPMLKIIPTLGVVK